jgi:hypothetical protein
MVVHNHETAEDYHRRALTHYQNLGFYWVDVPSPIGGCYGVPISRQRLGDVALAQGDLVDAQRHYGLALKATSDRPEIGLKLYVLLGPAALLAQVGDVERGVEAASLARHHPESVEETRSRADELLAELRGKLSPDAYAAAEARGRARDLEITVKELLEELDGKMVLHESHQGE